MERNSKNRRVARLASPPYSDLIISSGLLIGRIIIPETAGSDIQAVGGEIVKSEILEKGDRRRDQTDSDQCRLVA